jgi:predicted AlkP superfamily phosphohydrolase/phosphomutase
VNPDTGERAVTGVVRVAAAFPGGRTDRLPDLAVSWDERAPITALTSDAVGTVAAPSPDGRTGTHRPPGFLIARGPGFEPGSTIRGARVVDFAPTILHLLGLEVPPNLGGRRLS